MRYRCRQLSYVASRLPWTKSYACIDRAAVLHQVLDVGLLNAIGLKTSTVGKAGWAAVPISWAWAGSGLPFKARRDLAYHALGFISVALIFSWIYTAASVADWQPLFGG